MRDYEEKSYYEIQLDNKQLILVFLAGVTVCVLVFILGVMVGRGRHEAEMAAASRNNETHAPIRPEPDLEPPQEIQAAAPSTEQKKNKKQKEAEPKPEDVDYAYTELGNTDSEKPLVKEPSKTAKEETKPAKQETKAKEETKVAAKEEPKVEPKPVEKKPEPEPEIIKASEETKPEPVDASGRYTVQVMATASKPKAEAQLAALQQKGYTAYMNEEQAAGNAVFKVRVGKFTDADTARKTAARLKQELRLETWVAVLD